MEPIECPADESCRLVEREIHPLEDLARFHETLEESLPEWLPPSPAGGGLAAPETRLAELELKRAIESLIDPKLRFNIAGRDFVAAVGGDEYFDENLHRLFADGVGLLVRNANERIDRILPRRWCARWCSVIKALLRGRKYQVEALLDKIPFQVREVAIVQADGKIVCTVGRDEQDNKLANLLRSGSAPSESAESENGLRSRSRYRRKAKATTFSRLDYVAGINRRARWHLEISRGANCAIVAAVQGMTPPRFHQSLRFAANAIDDCLDPAVSLPDSAIHTLRRQLTQFFHLSRQRLESPFPWIQIMGTAAGSALAVSLVLGAYTLREHYRWNQLIASISRLPGIEITHHSAWVQPHLLTGLKDPLAPDPANIVSRFGFEPHEIDFEFTDYRSRHPVIVEQRARHLLQPPKTVSLRFHEDRIIAGGSASNEWFALCEERRADLPGDLILDLDGVVNSDLEPCKKLVRELTRHRIPFQPDEIVQPLVFDHDLRTISDLILELQQTAEDAGVPLEIQVVGRHSTPGEQPLDASHLDASRQRADHIRNLLLAMEPGLDSSALTSASERPLPGSTPNAHLRNQAVEFVVHLRGQTFGPDEAIALGAQAN